MSVNSFPQGRAYDGSANSSTATATHIAVQTAACAVATAQAQAKTQALLGLLSSMIRGAVGAALSRSPASNEATGTTAAPGARIGEGRPAAGRIASPTTAPVEAALAKTTAPASAQASPWTVPASQTSAPSSSERTAAPRSVNETAPTATADPAQLKVNEEKLKGIGNHPLGPEDDLLPPQEKHLSVAELKNLDGENGKKYKLMANLGNQEGIRDKLKQVVGDIDNDPKAFARGEAYLQKIKHMPNPDGSARPESIINNGKMEGATKDGDIRSGTELAKLKDSFKGGPHVPDEKAPTIDKAKAYGWLNEQKALAPTNDPHVKNGGNFISPAQVFFKKVADGIGDVFDFAGRFVKMTVGKIPGLGKLIELGVDMSMSVKAGLSRFVGDAIVGNDLGKSAKENLVKDQLQNLTEGIVGFVDPTGLGAKEVGKLARQGLDDAIPTGPNDGEKASGGASVNEKDKKAQGQQTDGSGGKRRR